MEWISETQNIPILEQYDVIVLGGGVAGCAAAVAAARAGSSVLLLEKMTVLGGLATAGHVVYYLPLCDGCGNKMAAGLAEELLQLSISHGANDLPKEWRGGPLHTATSRRYATTFLAGNFAFELERLICAEKVDFLYDTLFCAPIMEQNRCAGVLVENKSGRQAYLAKAFVDATGDGDLMFRAGASMEEQQNYLTYWSYCVERQKERRLHIYPIGNCDGGGLPDWSGRYSGVSAQEVTRFLKDSHRLAYEQLIVGQEENLEMASFPSMAQFRTTRRLRGSYTLTSADEGRSFSDSVGAIGDWRAPGKIYQIPYRTLYCSQLENVFSAGRNISAQGDAWEVTRVIPTAAVTGQAAGAAASLCVQYSCSASRLETTRLQALLTAQGALLSPEVHWLR